VQRENNRRGIKMRRQLAVIAASGAVGMAGLVGFAGAASAHPSPPPPPTHSVTGLVLVHGTASGCTVTWSAHSTANAVSTRETIVFTSTPASSPTTYTDVHAGATVTATEAATATVPVGTTAASVTVSATTQYGQTQVVSLTVVTPNCAIFVL
jgi:hypothetical protein